MVERKVKHNCWEFMQCGREPGGGRVSELGVCRAAEERRCDGVNDGHNGGRICWVVAGTLCGGTVQSSFAHQVSTCLRCPFYRRVRNEQKSHFQEGAEILSLLSDPLAMARACEHLSSLALAMALAEERDRQLIAEALHSRVAQTLGLVKIRLDRLGADLEDAKAVAELEAVGTLVTAAIHDARSLTGQISPAVLYELGLAPALEWLVEQMRSQYDLRFSLRSSGEPKDLTTDLRVLLFQAVRELLLNAAKHARASSVKLSVSWRRSSTVEISVRDNGVGIDASVLDRHPDGSAGFGLFSVRARLALLGGRLSVDSPASGGTHVSLVAPLALQRPAPNGVG